MTTWGMGSLGRIVMTPGVADWAQDEQARMAWLLRCLARHAAGDDGDVDDYDHAANLAAIEHGARVLSVYGWVDDDSAQAHDSRSRLWCVTEADRSVTTLLWPGEY